jgi:ATP-dependent RNA helicase DHX29
VTIIWSKDHELLIEPIIPMVSLTYPPLKSRARNPLRAVTIAAMTVSAPDQKASEAYIATCALFLLFNASPKEEKVFLRLPPPFRDLWSEFIEMKKERIENSDRDALRAIRDIVQAKNDRDEDEGVLLRDGFTKLAAGRNSYLQKGTPPIMEESQVNRESAAERLKQSWFYKQSAPSYQKMLVSRGYIHALTPLTFRP